MADHQWVLGLAGRRREKLEQLRQSLKTQIFIQPMDVMQTATARDQLQNLITAMGGMDLLIISAGISRRGASPQQEEEIIQTNINGFTALARSGFEFFTTQKSGHLVGISSISALRGRGENLAYAASKAYASNYLQGLRQKAFRAKMAITVTDVLAGWVDTPLIRGGSSRHFWVAPVNKACCQIFQAIQRKKSTVYITRRWRLLGWFLTLIPDWLHKRL